MSATVGDLYQTLGVDPQAAPEEIKRAYRRLARELHPDANPDDPEAEARFKEVARAYETLSDPQRRQRYDMFGDEGPGAGAGGGQPFDGGLGDIFSMFFGGDPFSGGGGGGRGPVGPPRGADLEVTVQLDLAEAAFGAEAPVAVRTSEPCDDCGASGAAPGSTPATCPDCGGAGQVRRVRQSILGQMVSTGPCPRCASTGTVIDAPCPACRGEGRRPVEKTYTVDIPPGIDAGQTLRLPGRGAAGPRGGPAGDLFVHVAVRPHERLVRHGDDLHLELPVAFTQAALGATLEVPTLDGEETVEVGAGTPTGTVVRRRGRGVPRLQGRGRGDLLITVVVEVPTDLDEAQEDLVRQLAEARGEPVAPPDAGLMGRLRSAFR